MSIDSPTLEVRLRSITFEATGIHSFLLEPVGGTSLPAFTAGAHVDVHLGGGVVRSYSLVNHQVERNRYRLGVALDAQSRGGSRRIHETWRVGEVLSIGVPRNNFPLDEQAGHSVLVAGGIGITPLWSMVQRLHALGRRWTLHYCARSAAHAAFLPEIEALVRQQADATLHTHFDDECGGARPDIAAMVAGAPADAHLYCCGPQPMLKAFETAASARAADHVHLEYFGAREEAAGGGYAVLLARSGRRIEVVDGKSMLDALLDAGIDVPYGCMQGVCGSCETRVLAGVPDHRDGILDAATRDANTSVIVCCSGSRTPELTLDL